VRDAEHVGPALEPRRHRIRSRGMATKRSGQPQHQTSRAAAQLGMQRLGGGTRLLPTVHYLAAMPMHFFGSPA
jgi:hypothetical protein